MVEDFPGTGCRSGMRHVTAACARAMVLLGLAAPAAAHGPAGHAEHAEPAADFQYDRPAATVATGMLGSPRCYDGDVAVVAGRRWAACLEFTPGKGDRILVGSMDDAGQWRGRPVVERFGQYAAPTLTADRKGRLWLTYEAGDEAGWDVYLVQLQAGRPVAQPRRVSSGHGANIHHRAAAAEDGLSLVWQADRGGQFDVMARRLVDGVLQDPQVVGDHPRGDWHPSVTVDGRGDVHVVWDAFVGRVFGVYLRSCRDGRWGEVRAVARSAAHEVRAAAAADADNRTWIVWEEGGQQWGSPYRGIATTSVRDRHGPLHRFRMLRLAVLQEDGRLLRLADPLPMPSVDAAIRRAGRPEGVERTGAFYERARLAVDRQGRPWIVYRHFYTPWLGIVHRSHVQQDWGIYARCYTADGWSPLQRMAVGQGDGLQRLEVAAIDNGLAALWTTGRTDRRATDGPRGLVTATVTARGAPPGAVPLARFEPPAGPRPAAAPAAEHGARRSLALHGKTYQLFFGDLHRHTDLSLCRVPIDGTIDDAYRYAIEAARLDFLGITDHTRDIARGDALSHLWWRCRKQVGRHQLVDGPVMRFIPFYAYERSHATTADHNVISLRGDMLRPYTYPVPQFWKELDRDTLTIPHQPIRRDTWNYQDDLLRPLVEIFQGCRDHAIEEDVHRGLAKGYHLGFIASSDHMSTGASYAGVWAEAPTRESIFRAMQARRTYAATDKIALAVHVDGHWMGEIFHAAPECRLRLMVQGTAPIRTVRLVVDGRTQETWTPRRTTVQFDVPLELRGRHYAYLHLEQADGNQAWSSPLWLDVAARDQPAPRTGGQ